MSDLREDLRRVRDEVRPPGDAFSRLLERREHKQRNRRLGAAVVALAVVAGGIGSAALLLRIGGRDGTHRVRSVGQPTVQLTLAPGQYAFQQVERYSLSGEGFDCGGCPLKFPSIRKARYRVWWTTDESGRSWVVDTDGRDFYSDDERRQYIEANGSIDPSPPKDETYAAGRFPNDTGDLSYLSTDPDTLLQQMIERMQPNGRSPEPYEQFTPGPGQEDHITAGLVRTVGELLDRPNASPSLRAALYQVAAGLQGMTVVRNATDPVGRPAVELKIQTEQMMHFWWFDPDSQQVLAREESSLDGRTVWSITIVEQAGIRSSTADDGEWVQRLVPDANPAAPPSIPDPRT
jgi:hypothetical protein